MSNIMTQTAVKTKTERMARTFKPVLASADGGNIPTTIELLKTGMWDTQNHGMFMVTEEDLAQYKENFDMGVAQAGDSGIMIDYDHQKGIAAGWIKKLTVGVDSSGVPTLLAEVEWTEQGKKDLLGKNYKCISPEFYPASRGGWPDPEQYDVYIPNVLAAAGLVNRPLFKGLKPIMASADSGKESQEKNIIYISASEKEKKSMTLEEVRAKDASALTEDEKSFLVEHKEDLTAEEQGKFGFEVTKETDEAKKEREAAEAKVAEEKAAREKQEAEAAEAAKQSAPDLSTAQPVMASAVKGDEGKVVMAASEVKELVDFKAASEKKEAESFVKEHIGRGAIKADQLNGTVDMLMSARGAQKTNLETMIKNLPDNAVTASEKGSSEKSANAVSANDQIVEKAKAAIEASADKKLDLRSAISQVRRENPELAKQADEENKN